MIKLNEILYKLKNLERRGWLIQDIRDPETKRVESVAEHCFSLAMLAWKIMEEEKLSLDKEKVLKMCLCHDLCEAEVGDITPFDGVSPEQKSKMELENAQEISRQANMPEIYSLFKEYEEVESDEAKFVKMLDKLDSVIQAKQYAKATGRDEIYKEFENAYIEIVLKFKKYI